MDWSGVDYLWVIVMLLSAVWALILTAPIHSIGEQVMNANLYISPNRSDEESNSSASRTAYGWVNIHHFGFGVNYSLK